MNQTGPLSLADDIVYPESDGEPMADDIIQLRWIVVLYGNLAALYRHVQDVFVGGNQFWYPVEGRSDLRYAPDVYVVFGRPKGDRPSYKQWLENNVPMTVVFEILSPKNTHTEMADKQAFYEDYGAEECYVFDPDLKRLWVYLRKGDVFLRERHRGDFVSPRLGIRFDLSGPEMKVFYPNGRPFLSFEELEEERQREEQLRLQEQQLRVAAEHRADQAERRAARLAELSRKARRQLATPAELAELEQLEGPNENPSGPPQPIPPAS